MNPTTTDTGGAAPPAVSPLSLQEAQSRLILRHAELTKELPKLKQDAERATKRLREIRAELRNIERVLRAHERIDNPRRRAKP